MIAEEPPPVKKVTLDDLILGPGVEITRGSRPTITISGGGAVSASLNILFLD